MSFPPDSGIADAVKPAANFEARRGGRAADILLLHYTGMLSCDRAIDWLCRVESRVSCHYVVDVDGRITQLVGEGERAWHAGAGSWGGETDINSRSIGIEIHNPGHELGYPEFPEAQMRAVAMLARDIVRRHQIAPQRVIAHSDIAPERKIDPGEKFDWSWLAREGVGHWVAPEPVDPMDLGLGPNATGAQVAEAQRLLGLYGYGVSVSGRMDERTAIVLRAFQRHFRPARVDGWLDHSTSDTLRRLIAALPTA
jgi:N-acetylmuramoyl-L-alanine amidase